MSFKNLKPDSPLTMVTRKPYTVENLTVIYPCLIYYASYFCSDSFCFLKTTKYSFILFLVGNEDSGCSHIFVSV